MPGLVEQEPWIGSKYSTSGILGQKIAIVGQWRHYKTKVAASRQFTIEFMRDWLETKPMNYFFSYIPNYFPPEARGEFWDRVIFFNLLPNCVDSSSDKFSVGDRAALSSARARFSRIVENCRPEKVLVFSNSPGKGWMALREKIRNGCPMGSGLPKEFEFGEYATPNYSARVYGLRYPQGAPHETMRRAIDFVLKHA